MDTVLMLGVEEAPELDSGVAAKLRAAATANPLALPLGKGAVKGRQFRVLAALARLSEIEMFALGSWLEDCYGEDHLARFEAELKTVTSRSTAHASAPVAAAPVSASMGAGVSEAAVHSLSSEFEMLGRSPAPAGGAVAHAPVVPLTSTKADDERDHGFDAGMIAILTFLLHTARLPPPAHEEVKYNVDPSFMTKLYKVYKAAPGTILWDMVTNEKTTFAQFQEHFHNAAQASQAEFPLVSQRISSHWLEMQRYFDSARLVRRYYHRLLTTFRGRGIPKLVDERIVMLVMCSEVNSAVGGGSGSTELQAAVDRLTQLVQSQGQIITTLKESVSSLKSEVNNFKDQIKAAGNKNKFHCEYCGEDGHTIERCRTRIRDEAKAKKEAEK